jgi:hypothetical protein
VLWRAEFDGINVKCLVVNVAVVNYMFLRLTLEKLKKVLVGGKAKERPFGRPDGL